MDNKIMKQIIFLTFLTVYHPLLAADKKPVGNEQETTPAPARLVTASSSDTQITVSWKLPEDNRVVSAHLYRKTYELPMQSSKGLDLGELIAQLDVTRQSFTDTQVKPDKRYYYRLVVLNDLNLKSSPSLPAIASLKDLIPPLPVASMNAKPIDSTQFKLRWTASESDDVVAYRIYRARENSPPVIVKTMSLKKKGERFFNTTVKQKKDLQIIYNYAVAAVDGAGNVSDLSDYSSVRLPDSIAPLNPLQLNIKQSDGMLELNWLPSTENDIAGYKVYRQQGVTKKGQPSNPFKPLHKGLIEINQYVDIQIKPLSSYTYRVAAVDNYGNESKAGRGIVVRTMQFDRTIPTPSRLVIKTGKKGYPTLNWQHKKNGAGLKMRVYRSDGEDFQAVSSLLDKNQFTDTSVIGGRVYKYQIKTVSAVGKLSAASNAVMWTGGEK